MEPSAYVLRDHPVFHQPLRVDRNAKITIPTPDAWKHALSEANVEVFPLVQDPHGQHSPGWCTYTYEHEQAPELEVICGGLNSKTPLAGAVWRQGHLLHFGFEQSPAEMNERGRALLVNAICYISRFTEDRPIVRSPSGFYSNKRVLDRGALDRLIRNPERDLTQYLRWMAAPEVREALQGLSRDEVQRWLKENRGFLVADEQGHYVIDAEARKFGVPPDSEGFIPRAMEAWKKSGSGESLAEKLLRRYVPEGPEKGATPDEWRKWWEENRPYLFFSETGGYRWYVDPLAKKRQTPCSELRGTKRATGRPIPAAAAG